jgi:hypothetical protein
MTAAADRNLLFGLLALQNGIINQGQLVAAFQAWTLEKSRRLADHLEARGDLTGARRGLLEGLVEVHLEAHGGDVQQSLAAVSAGKSTRDSLARLGDPDINNTLGHVACGHGLTDDDRTASYAVGTATSDGQRFRVLRPHARGGLGAVFVALDTELHREVALKQMLDHHADDPQSRQRFLIEAEITGGLEHPGIVPVYGLGAYAGGRPITPCGSSRATRSRKPSRPSMDQRTKFHPRPDGEWVPECNPPSSVLRTSSPPGEKGRVRGRLITWASVFRSPIIPRPNGERVPEGRVLAWARGTGVRSPPRSPCTNCCAASPTSATPSNTPIPAACSTGVIAPMPLITRPFWAFSP